LKTIYWISPSFFANRTRLNSRNPLTHMRNHRQLNGPVLALLECWSMNVPTLVLKKESWYCVDGQPYPASTTLYIFDSVGQFSNSTAFSEDDFKYFFSKLKNFSPRESVRESFGLTGCASRLFELLEL
jgi:hypothetical protein